MPAANSFSLTPAAWYLFGRSRQLRTGPISKDLLGRRLVAYRTSAGRPVVMDARCSHMNADLGCGQVVGDGIRCPFHHWEYGPDGRCRRIPAESVIPEFARQVTYPVTERHGLVFIFNGPEALFPLPFFADCEADDFVAGRPFQFVGDCSWFMLAANGFDSQHFQAVHDRRLTSPPVVDCPGQFTRRMQFSAEVAGHSVFDRLLRRFVGKSVDISITCWGGTLILVTGFFERARSYILIALEPIDFSRTLTRVIVFAPRGKPGSLANLLAPFSLEVRRTFTRGFMRDDIDRLPGIRLNERGFVPSDHLMREFFDWLLTLPGGGTGDSIRRDAVDAGGVKPAGSENGGNSSTNNILAKETPC